MFASYYFRNTLKKKYIHSFHFFKILKEKKSWSIHNGTLKFHQKQSLLYKPFLFSKVRYYLKRKVSIFFPLKFLKCYRKEFICCHYTKLLNILKFSWKSISSFHIFFQSFLFQSVLNFLFSKRKKNVQFVSKKPIILRHILTLSNKIEKCLCIPSVCASWNSRKYFSDVWKFIYVIHIWCNMGRIENDIYGAKDSFVESRKRFPAHYGL